MIGFKVVSSRLLNGMYCCSAMSHCLATVVTQAAGSVQENAQWYRKPRHQGPYRHAFGIRTKLGQIQTDLHSTEATAMWRTSRGERVLKGAEWDLFREGLIELWDTVEDDFDPGAASLGRS